MYLYGSLDRLSSAEIEQLYARQEATRRTYSRPKPAPRSGNSMSRTDWEQLRQHCFVHSVARPRTDPVVAERDALVRIAELAASIGNTLRQPGRGRYSSERTLRQWLSEDEVQYTVADIGPALTLLEVTGRLIRPEVGEVCSVWRTRHSPI
jgi:hypothetical protein